MKDIYIDFFDKSKFASKHIDKVANQIFTNIESGNIRFYFDLTSFDWIAPECLIFLTSLFCHFNFNDIAFYVKFKKVKFNYEMTYKDARRLIYIWEVWGIYKSLKKNYSIIPDYSVHCDIDDVYIESLKKLHNIGKNKGVTEIYDSWKTVTEYPFFAYQSINSYTKYDEESFETEIAECISLTEEGDSELDIKLSKNPFIDKTLSSIILRELFENSINHGFEKKSKKEFFFGLGFNQEKKTSTYLRKNFYDEAIPETINFFLDKNRRFKNEPFIEFSFLDFGRGIHSTLDKEYQIFISDKNNLEDLSTEHLSQHEHAQILEYAFYHNSSRNPIDVRFEGDLIPRGLYDLLSIIWRYGGVLIARSGKGKILYDFSDSKIKHPKEAVKFFSSSEYLFLGTMVTIYLPPRITSIEIQRIKTITNVKLSTSFQENKYLDIIKLFSKINHDNQIKKEEDTSGDYGLLFRELDKELKNRFNQTNDTIIPLDFAGCDFEKEFTKKVLFYLISTSNIKLNTIIIVLNIADKAYIEQLQDELIGLKSHRKRFTFQPILCLFDSIKYKLTQETIWLGIGDRNEEEEHNKKLEAFIKSQSHEGKSINEWLIDSYLPQLIEENTIKPTNDENLLYLTSGNYFQKQFLSFLETFQNESFVHRISKHLVNKLLYKPFDKLRESIDSKANNKIAIISVTVSSQLLAKSVKKQLEITFPENSFELIRLSNYYSFFTERPFLNLRDNQPVILVCDVIATGHLLDQVNLMLENLKKTNLLGILTVSDTRKSKGSDIPSKYIDNDNEKVIALTQTTIPKYDFKGFFEDITNRDRDFGIERVNPITNGLNSRDKHKYSDNCLFKPDEFLNMLPSDKEQFLKIGFIENNQSFHTYFFETTKFFQSDEGDSFIAKCLDKISEKILSINIGCVIYPIFSSAEFSIEENYKKIFRKFSRGKIDYIAAPRVNTPKGWRFTTIPDIYTIKKYDTIFIIDDGSCSGETILQLLDEVSVFTAKAVIILSLIARVEDFQREFFSKISQIRCQSGEIPLHVFFGVHFHIQVYNNSSYEGFLEEEKNLKLLNKNPLFPQIAKNHITNRLNALYRIDSSNLINHEYPDYLPIMKDTNKINCTEIFKWRNLLGCIQGYKFYKEYFDEFTNLHKEYLSNNDKSQKNAIQNLETIGAIILHEPELVQTIKNLLPDIYELLGRFIKSVVIGELKQKKNKNLEEVTLGSIVIFKYKRENLHYKWSSFSLVCLYALTNKRNFFQQQDSNNILLILLNFCKGDSKSMDYLIYLICNQVPSVKEQVFSKPNRLYIEGFIKKFITDHNSKLHINEIQNLEHTLIYFCK